MTTRSYFVFSVESDRAEAAARVRSHSLVNAKHLVWPTFINELVVHIEANSLEDLDRAAKTLSQLPGIKRSTVLAHDAAGVRAGGSAVAAELETLLSQCRSAAAKLDNSPAPTAVELARRSLLKQGVSRLELAQQALGLAHRYERDIGDIAERLGGPLASLLAFWSQPTGDTDPAEVAELGAHAEARVRMAFEDLEQLATRVPPTLQS